MRCTSNPLSQDMLSIWDVIRDEKQTLESVTRVINNMSDNYRKKQCQDYLRTITEMPGFAG